MFRQLLNGIIGFIAQRARKIAVVNSAYQDLKAAAEWLDTEEGQAWQTLGEKVYDCLEAGTEAKPSKKRIKFPNGPELTVAQTSLRLAEQLKESPIAIREHVVMWLEEASMPNDPNMDGDQQKEFEKAIERWVSEERAKLKLKS